MWLARLRGNRPAVTGNPGAVLVEHVGFRVPDRHPVSDPVVRHELNQVLPTVPAEPTAVGFDVKIAPVGVEVGVRSGVHMGKILIPDVDVKVLPAVVD